MKIATQTPADGAWPDGWDIDCLVDGSLAEEQRAALLLKLDASPNGWKRCALAFLEAQTFRDALAPLRLAPKGKAADSAELRLSTRSPERLGISAVLVPSDPVAAPARKKRSTPWFAAACAVVAFCAGWAIKPASPPAQEWATKPEVDTALLDGASNREPSGKSPAPAESSGHASTDRGVGELSSPPALAQSAGALAQSGVARSTNELMVRSLEEAIRQMEKKGYRADVQSQLVSVKTPDGRTVELPVREVTLKYRGKQTY